VPKFLPADDSSIGQQVTGRVIPDFIKLVHSGRALFLVRSSDE